MSSVLIIGCGSIGERHLRCFQRTARCAVAACDSNAALLGSMREKYAVPVFASLDAALAGSRFDAAVICTPAPLHLPMAVKLLSAGMHVFIEKPLSIDDALVPAVRAAIASSGRFVAVAYVYHVMPWLAGARGLLSGGGLGKALHASITAGQHFPTFRPAYRDIYYARREQGGGAVQDALTHLLNAVEWLIGPGTRVFCDAAHQALEGVTVEDTVNVTARHGSVLVSYAMNQFQSPNETTILIHCERGSLKIEGHQQRWGVLRTGDKDWSWQKTPPLERDDLFIAQANAFLDGMEGRATPICTFEQAVQTLKFNQAALRSADTGLPVTIE
ncbi:MAG: Gfo/Idh/MocA family oxidoreductase [Verrucomicrobia bacterium]|nr:Gfo/Idh/MocA family oxidoreductase [Verrucomicrobiota bacterium]